MMLNLAVVDDEAAERQRIRECLGYVSEKTGTEFCIDEFSSADSFLVGYEDKYDIVFMDIEFPSGLDGMAAARELRKFDKTVILIFITNMAQLAIHGYEVDALDFIVKPLDQYAFLLKMTRALERVTLRLDNSIRILMEGEVIVLRSRLIRYLEVQGHYIIYHSREGTFSEYISLSAAEKKLNDPAFFRCNRGCLVNLRFVTEVKKDVCVVDGEEVPVARTQRTAFIKALADHLGGGGAPYRRG